MGFFARLDLRRRIAAASFQRRVNELEHSIRQVETSHTIVLDGPRRARTVFEQLLAGSMDLGCPEHVVVIFGRKVTSATPGSFDPGCSNRPDQGHR